MRKPGSQEKASRRPLLLVCWLPHGYFPVFLCLLFSEDAHAILKGLARPRQTMLRYLPYLVGLAVLLAAAIVVAVKRVAIRRLVCSLRAMAHRSTVVTLAAAMLLVAVPTVALVCHLRGGAPGTSGPKRLERVWDFSDDFLESPFAGSPAVAAGRVYVGSDNQRLYCLDAANGRVVWKFTAACELFAAPVVADGCVYVGEGLHESKDSKLYCLDAATGEPRWSFPTGSHIEFSPTLFDGKLYFAAGEDGVYCIDARDGRKLWQFASVHVDMTPALTADGVYFGNAYGSPGFYRLDPKSGDVVWQVPAPYGVCGSPATDGTRVYFGLGNGTFGMSHAQPKGSLWCLSTATGTTIWTCDARDAVLTTVALAGGLAYFGSRDGDVYCVDAATGEVRWTFDTGSPVLSSPAVAGGRVYCGSDGGWVYCIDAARGELVSKFDASGLAFSPDARVICSPAVAGGRVYAGSMNGHFFCLGEAPDANAKP